MKNYQENRAYLDGELKFGLHFGGDNTGRSIIKSVLALIHAAGISVSECKLALDYLIGDGEPCFGYYYSVNGGRKVPIYGG